MSKIKLFVFLILFSSISFAENQKISVLTFDYPPFMFKKQIGKHKGLEIDLFEIFLSHKKYDFSYSFYPIKRAIAKLNQDSNNDYIYIGTSKHFSKEIENQKYVKIDFGVASFVPYTLKNNMNLSNLKIDLSYLKNKKVAAIRGSSVVNFLKSNNVDVVEVTTFENFFKLLLMRRVDIAIVLETAGDYHIREIAPYLEPAIEKIDAPIFSIPLSIVIKKSNSSLEKIYRDLIEGRKNAINNGIVTKLLKENYNYKTIPNKFLEI